MEFLDQIAALLQQNQKAFLDVARLIAAVGVVFVCLSGSNLVTKLPIRRFRFGPLRLDLLLKFLVIAVIVAWMAGATLSVVLLPLLVVAKLFLIHVMICAGLLCWVFILSGPQIDRGLTQIQQDCELATNLTFLQAEMARAQLDSMNEKIRNSLEPEEREITETMLKSISPLVSLFLHKERSVVKWSIAAVDVGKVMMHYFWSPKR